MADLGTIFQALQAAESSAKTDNPYSGLAAIPAQVGEGVVKNSANYSDTENLLGPLILGLLSGTAEGAGDRFQDRQSGLAREVIANAMAGNGVTRPDGMSPSVFSTLENAGSLFSVANNLSEASEARKEARSLRSNLLQEIVKGAIDKPYQSKRAIQALQELFPQGAGEGAPAEPVATQPMTEREKLLEKYQGREEMADAEQRRDLEAPDRTRTGEDQLRNSFQGLKPVVQFAVVADNLALMRAARDDGSGVSDFAFSIPMMQIMDPNSIVRDTEQAMVIAKQSLPESLANSVIGSLQGRAKLGPEVRAQLMRLAEQKYMAMDADVTALEGQYGDLARQRGLNPAAVLIRPGHPDPLGKRAMGTPPPARQGAAMAPPMPAPPGGSSSAADPSQGGTLKMQVNKSTGETRWVPR